MNFFKKMVSLVLCFVLIAALGITAFAANGETNLYSEISATHVEVGDEFTFTLYNNDMTASGVKAGFYFDNTKLEVSKITWSDIVAYSEEEEDDVEIQPLSKTAKKKANEDGSALGVYVINMGVDSQCYEGTIVTVKFKAIANGEAKIILREETLGSDEFQSDSVETITVTVGSSEPEHVCADNNNDHKCDGCGEKMSDCADKNNDHNCDVCGQKMSDCADENNDHNCDVCGQKMTDCTDENKDHKCDVCGNTSDCADNDKDHKCDVCGEKLGDHNFGDGFECDCGQQLNGWQQKGDNWYYVVDGKPVTGTYRAPYLEGYAPNAEDVAFAQANDDSMYTDAETAVFVFGEDGVFQSDFTGIIGDRYAVNGVIAWHVGLVEVNGEYYYFVGDVNGGGNIAANGDVYVTRLNGIEGFVLKGVYNFKDGKLSGLSGLVDRLIEGDLYYYYYENSRLMMGNGLTKFGDELIYVRSNGQIATGKYWVSKPNELCKVGMYNFGDDGFMQTAKDPNFNGLKDGVYYKDGMPYYAGLIEINGEIYYVTSSGDVATGTYYITKLDNYTGSLTFNRGDKLTFDAEGKLVTK